MLDWPTAAVVLGVLVSATALARKWIESKQPPPPAPPAPPTPEPPQIDVETVRLAVSLTQTLREDVAALKAREESFYQQFDQVRTELHNLWSEIGELRKVLLQFMNQLTTPPRGGQG